MRDNPGIPFGDLSRIIGDQVSSSRSLDETDHLTLLFLSQWRRLSAPERDKYEERAREQAKERDAPPPPMPIMSEPPLQVPPRMINGPVAINGYYQSECTHAHLPPSRHLLAALRRPADERHSTRAAQSAAGDGDQRSTAGASRDALGNVQSVHRPSEKRSPIHLGLAEANQSVDHEQRAFLLAHTPVALVHEQQSRLSQ